MLQDALGANLGLCSVAARGNTRLTLSIGYALELTYEGLSVAKGVQHLFPNAK